MATAQSLYREQEFLAFDFDAGPDGFPDPGQIVRHFRQIKCKANGKTWTQRDLAQVLGIRELAAREMELRNTGLYDITRLRFLVLVLDIPLVLFGLAIVPDLKGGDSSWWEKLGFPAFDAEPDGFPRPGQVIRHFRQIKHKANGKPWTQGDLAQVLGIQELAVRVMELKDTSLNDISRRRFLTHLLDIPPLLLGLVPLAQYQSVTAQRRAVSAPQVHMVARPIDLEEVRDKLTEFWTQQACTPQNMLTTIDSTLKRLYERYPITSKDGCGEIVTNMCEMHIHVANILRDRGSFSKSLGHLKKAEDLNTLLKEDELGADVLYRRGGVYLDQGKIELALDAYHTAEEVLQNLSAPLQAAVLLETALSDTKLATSSRERIRALEKLDRAGHIIRVGHTEAGRKNWPYLHVDLGRYHLDRSAALIVAGYPKAAQDELKLITSSQLQGRRSVYHLILQARACLLLKEYAQVALLAEEALPLARTMNSHVNLERIKMLYQQLQQTPFRNNPEVARLSYLLFHA